MGRRYFFAFFAVGVTAQCGGGTKNTPVDACSVGVEGCAGSGGQAAGSGGTGGADAGVDGAAGAGGGTGGSDGRDAPSSQEAGSIMRRCGATGPRCTNLEWCDYPEDSCGAAGQQGECRRRDALEPDCLADRPVCACDGKSYRNACSAHFVGSDATASRSCVTGNGDVGANCFADADCRDGLKCCRAGGTPAAPIACLAPAGAGCPPFP